MQNYDYIVIGAGAANSFAFSAAAKGYKTLIIDESYPGGTCLNRGCIPTKVLLQSADVAHYIKTSEMYGIKSKIESVDMSKIKQRVEDIVLFWRNRLIKALNNTPNLTFINKIAKFVSEKIIEIDGEKIRGNRFVLAVGSRPIIPKIEGLDRIKYLTNENILELTELPKSIGILGGGYIGMEFAHFFHSLGSEVYIIEMKDYLLNEIEESLRDNFNEYMRSEMKVFTATALKSVYENNNKKILVCENNSGKFEIAVDELLVAVGRRSNADKLDCVKTNVILNNYGYIIADEYLQTSNSDIWALGDCIGTPAFRHTANYQCDILEKNLLFNKKIKADYSITPFAVFTFPEIASVGLTASAARQKYQKITIKKLGYFGNAKGKAIGYKGFCKAVIDDNTEKILGFHIIGPYASILIHEILPIMTAGLSYKKIEETIHIHPALSELIIWTFTEGKEI